MDEVTQAFVDSKFDADGEPVSGGGDDWGSSFDDTDFVFDQPGFRNESELAAAYVQANDDARSVDRATSLLDQANLETLALQEQLQEDQLLGDYGYGDGQQVGQPAWLPPCPPGVDPQDWATSNMVAREVLAQQLATEAMQMQPAQPTAAEQIGQTIAQSTSEALAGLAEVERSRSEREAWNEQQTQTQFSQDVVEAYSAAVEIAQPLLERHNASHADMAAVLSDASAILEASGYTSEVISQMDEWTSRELAREAISNAAERAGHAAIARNVLKQYGGR